MKKMIFDYVAVSDAKNEMASREALGFAIRELRKVLGPDGFELFIKWNKNEAMKRCLD